MSFICSAVMYPIFWGVSNLPTAHCSPQVLLLDDHPTYLREARFAGEPLKKSSIWWVEKCFFFIHLCQVVLR